MIEGDGATGVQQPQPAEVGVKHGDVREALVRHHQGELHVSCNRDEVIVVTAIVSLNLAYMQERLLASQRRSPQTSGYTLNRSPSIFYNLIVGLRTKGGKSGRGAATMATIALRSLAIAILRSNCRSWHHNIISKFIQLFVF